MIRKSFVRARNNRIDVKAAPAAKYENHSLWFVVYTLLNEARSFLLDVCMQFTRFGCRQCQHKPRTRTHTHSHPVAREVLHRCRRELEQKCKKVWTQQTNRITRMYPSECRSMLFAFQVLNVVVAARVFTNSPFHLRWHRYSQHSVQHIHFFLWIFWLLLFRGCAPVFEECLRNRLLFALASPTRMH